MKVLTVSVLLCVAFALRAAAGPEEAAEAVVKEELVPVEGAELVNGDEVHPAAGRMVYCPPGWLRYGSRCFLFVSSWMNWKNAEQHCVSQLGALASAQNPAEYHFLQSLVQNSGRTNAWLGGFYFDNTWMWIDRAGFYYTNWYYLNNAASYPCLQMSSTRGWINTNCAASLPFVCVRNTAC